MTNKKQLAFGVDSRRCEKYSLRQSRYYVIAKDVSRIVSEIKSKNQRVKLLDIGVASGVSRRYIENQPNNEVIDYYGADIEIRDDIYKKESYSCLYQADLMQGMLNVPSNSFDIVICEQVLEHLDELELAFKSIERVLKPGGTLFLGVPIFPHGIHLVRRYLVPLIDKICRVKKVRGHVQAFSLITFTKLLHKYTELEILEHRGFRVISGGILRPLENHKWWLDFNHKLGKLIPSLCIEIQIVAKKNEQHDR
ncbi:MAG: methyltransferase domain-containing protein [Candidatus Tisiphia sp.]|nr:methyltransferase domain-containing protein [Candidatus Tisiphia sp.]